MRSAVGRVVLGRPIGARVEDGHYAGWGSLARTRLDRSEDVGLVVPEVLEVGVQRGSDEAELLVGELDRLHGRSLRLRGDNPATWLVAARIRASEYFLVD